MNRGFTLVELLICIAIFVIVTAFVVVKYGTFNQSALLTDTAYDIALALHTAQSYGLAVKESNVPCTNNGLTGTFDCAYGINFTSSASDSCGTPPSSPTSMTLFADTSGSDRICSGGDTTVASYAITRGAKISCLYAGSAPAACTSGNSVSQLDVTFLRPNPDATICANGLSSSCSSSYGQITLEGTDGSTRTISIYQNGQITVNQ